MAKNKDMNKKNQATESKTNTTKTPGTVNSADDCSNKKNEGTSYSNTKNNSSEQY